jgi:hypothetical protein
MLRKAAENKDLAMVGATGIEPVTPAMSRPAPSANLLINNEVPLWMTRL